MEHARAAFAPLDTEVNDKTTYTHISQEFKAATAYRPFVSTPISQNLAPVLINRCFSTLFPGCAFLTYYSRDSAISAQNALHEKRTLPGVSVYTFRTQFTYFRTSSTSTHPLSEFSRRISHPISRNETWTVVQGVNRKARTGFAVLNCMLNRELPFRRYNYPRRKNSILPIIYNRKKAIGCLMNTCKYME